MESLVKAYVIPPLFIDAVRVPGVGGTIGMTICPGRKEQSRIPSCRDRNLDADILHIKEWGAAALVTLIDTLELRLLQVSDLPEKAAVFQLEWIHLPMPKLGLYDPDDSAFQMKWKSAGERIKTLLKEGKKVVIHCNEGIGRTGIITARLLVELGVPSDAAIELTRKARPGALEVGSHERYVRRCCMARS